MKNYLKDIIKAVSVKHLVFISFLSFAILDFITSLSFEYTEIRLILNSYPRSVFLALSYNTILFIIWIAISLFFKRKSSISLNYSSIILSPILLLFFWRPQGVWPSFMIPIIISLSTQVCFFAILSKQDFLARINTSKQKIFIVVVVVLYFSIFSYITMQKLNSFCLFDPKDFAIYNQSFWNTINGRPFQNSTYGSNFACHNTIFFFALVPFYYIFPNPLTLLILKTLLLSFSAIPFYLMARYILKDISAFVLTLAYMFYPFLVSLNFLPPHEICYSPLIILFTFYFFRQNRFWPFVLFLILSLSIKEHLSLVALMFGLYSLFCKESPRWILTPMLLGIAWSIFSLTIILHFQEIYQTQPYAAWFLTFLKARFLSQKGDILNSVISGLSYANIGNWHNLKSVFLLLSPLGIIAPLLSPVSFLGLPELIINLISDRPAMLSPLRHYNVIVSIFLLIGAFEGVKKLSDFRWVKNLKIETHGLRLLASVFILASTLIHSYLWLDSAEYSKDAAYIETVDSAISLIPKDAFVTVPADMAVHISNRERYSLIGEGEYGDYIVIDKNSSHLFKRKEIIDNYTEIFNKAGISVFIRRDVS